MVANKQARKDREVYEILENNFKSRQEKKVRYVSASTTFYPSDQMHFKKSIAVSSMNKAPLIGYYMGRIHTPFDTRFDERNIALIKESMTNFVNSFSLLN